MEKGGEKRSGEALEQMADEESRKKARKSVSPPAPSRPQTMEQMPAEAVVKNPSLHASSSSMAMPLALHGMGRCSPMTGKSRFFKILTPESSNSLVLPMSFMRNITREPPWAASLVGPSGREWPVVLDWKAGEAAAFKDGWADFVADHSLMCGDLFVFKYDWQRKFKVLMFDHSGFEKKTHKNTPLSKRYEPQYKGTFISTEIESFVDRSSDESSEISESDVNDYEEKYYSRLKSGGYNVISKERSFRCPFCSQKKSKEYRHNDLLQHASAIGTSGKAGKARATHLALAKYLKDEFPAAATSSPQPEMMDVEKVRERSHLDQHEKFVWAWKGVLVNIPRLFKDGRFVGENGNKMKQYLCKFNPQKVIPLWHFKGHTRTAIVDFNRGWNGFMDAMAFEYSFEAQRLGKRDWYKGEKHGTELYGWVARADDYWSSCPIGEHLRMNGDLKSVNGLVEEESDKTAKLVADLENQIEVRDKNLLELESKFNESTNSLNKMMEEREVLLQTYNKEIQKMQSMARDHSRKIIEENEKLRTELDNNQKEIFDKNKEIEKLVVQRDTERRKIDDMEMKNARINKRRRLATLEQKKHHESVLQLLKEQKMEKETALSKIHQLEKQLESKEKLKLEIQKLKGELKVTMDMRGQDAGIKQKMEDMINELNEKMKEMDDLELLNQTLGVKKGSSSAGS